MNRDYDVIIAGAGLTGASLALALADQGMRIGVVEARGLVDGDAPAQGGKALALAAPTVRFLQTLDVWSGVRAQAAPIDEVHVSQRGRFGVTRLRAAELGMETLGHVVPGALLAQCLHRRLREAADIRVLCPYAVTGIERAASGNDVVLEGGAETMRCRASLTVGADGARSGVRRLLGIEADSRDYHQQALSALVTPERAHRGRAYERFTAAGPIALLPLADRRMGLVWTGAPEAIQALLELDDAQLLQRLHQSFGDRLGAFTAIGPRKSYPLHGCFAKEVVRPGAVLVGNAAQTLHPVAAQGFNLGARDVATLARVLVQAKAEGRVLGDEALLQEYARLRAPDRRRTQRFTHSLAQGFLSDFWPLPKLRGAGLVALDVVAPLKRAFARKAMGLH